MTQSDPEVCDVCGGAGAIEVARHDWVHDEPCPKCRMADWPHGFPGMHVMRGGRIIWLIKPTLPGETPRTTHHFKEQHDNR